MPRAPLRTLKTPDDIGEYVATRILRGIDAATQDGRRYLLGLPTGRTPRPVYAALTRALASAPRSLRHVTLVMMDEYLVEVADGYEYAMDAGAPSCHQAWPGKSRATGIGARLKYSAMPRASSTTFTTLGLL